MIPARIDRIVQYANRDPYHATRMSHVIYVAIAFVAACVSSVFGLGGAPLLLTFGALVLPIRETIGLATIMFTASSIAKAILYHGDLDWRLCAIFTVGSVPFAIVGAHLMVVTSPELLQRLLAAVVVAYVVSDTFGRVSLPQPRTPIWFVSAAVYGFLSGLIGTGQVVKVILLSAARLRKQAFVGTMAATGLISNIAQMSTYIRAEILTDRHVGIGVVLCLAAVAAALMGRLVLRELQVEAFERGARFVLIIAAVALWFR